MKPVVTFCLISHNHDKFIQEAVRGALQQTYQPLEIFICDDCSTDRSFEIITEETGRYQGPHAIRIHRQPERRGLAECINHVMGVCSGEFVVVAASDDVSHADRAEALANAWLKSGRKASLVHSGFRRIDQAGKELALTPIEVRAQSGSDEQVQIVPPEKCIATFAPFVYGCTGSWDRKLFTDFGPLKANVCQEDVVLSFRAELAGGIIFLKAPLVDYRLHGSNIYHSDFSLMQSGRAANQDELARIEAFHLRNLRFRYAIYENFTADIKTAGQLGLLEAGRVEALLALTQRRKWATDAEIALREGTAFQRLKGLIDLYRCEGKLSGGKALRVLPTWLYRKLRVAFFHG